MLQGKTVHEIIEATISSAQASVSVMLVLLYGYLVRKYNWISKAGESDVSKLGTTFLLPALLFTEMGPLSSWDNLHHFWPIPVFSLIFQLISLLVAQFLHVVFKMPQHYVPIYIFNNVTSLPLLLISSLADTGSLDSLLHPGEDLASGVSRGKVYFLINALVGNLTRFALGPYLMKEHDAFAWFHAHVEDPLPDHKHTTDGAITLPTSTEDSIESDPFTDSNASQEPIKLTIQQRAIKYAKKARELAVGILNPPLVGGLSAVIIGVVPFLHHQFFDGKILAPLTTSIRNVGNLYSVLQMFVLGAHLYSKKGGKANAIWLIVLFAYRFFMSPLISIGSIYLVRTHWPNVMHSDAMMDFVMGLSNVGPPALTLSAIADMSDLSSEINGQVSRIITWSYVVTPLISFAVSGSIHVAEVGKRVD